MAGWADCGLAGSGRGGPESCRLIDYSARQFSTTHAFPMRLREGPLPNHYRTLAIIEANLGLATDEERRTFAEYQEHVRGLSERHICGVSGRAIRFPGAMEGMFA